MKTKSLIPQVSFVTVTFRLVLLAVISTSSFQARADYIGAAAVLQKAAGENAAPLKVESPRVKERARLRADLKAFPKQAATLAPEDAAKGWVQLFDRFIQVSHGSMNDRNENEEPLNFDLVWAVLPAPVAWDALGKIVEGRPPAKGIAASSREICLRLLVHTLQANQPAQKADLSALEALLAKSDRNESYSLVQMYQNLRRSQQQFSSDPNAILKTLEQELDQSQGEGNYHMGIQVPNLIALVGTNKTEEFLRRALRTANSEIEIEQGNETKALARKLALEMISDLKVAQWSLTYSLETTELFEAMEKRFAKPEPDTNNPADILSLRGFKPDNGAHIRAKAYYLLGLIVHQRTKEAVALAQKLGKEQQPYVPVEALTSLQRSGHGRELNDFFHELLTQNPALPFWNQYVEIAAAAGKSEEMLALVRTAVTREDLNERQRAAIREHLYKALLAADKVEEGVQEMQKKSAPADKQEEENPGNYSAYGNGPAETGLKLAQIGDLLDRKEWTDAGIAMVAATKKDTHSNRSGGDPTVTIALADLLANSGRGSEAEALLTEELAAALRAEKENPNSGMWGMEPTRPLLIALAQLYQRADRPADVIVLLEQAPQWGVKDLAEIFQENGSLQMFRTAHTTGGSSLGYLTAWALTKTGRNDEARKIILASLDQDDSADPIYELLLKTGSTNLVVYLDSLYARDRFEERPLIWKAHILREAGKLEEAEAAARQAIAVDPSDGEQGPGRRMRAYAELADIRQALGDLKQAEFFRGAVTAIRLSEKADRYYEAGLLSRAVKMYQESLNHFADAYCIQSRLALRMSELGLHEEAEAHYRRAYELMPESFGRVESHCFGCEGVFKGDRAQSIAEKVFNDLAIKEPQKPQVHYLLGYLREEQGRFQDALPELQTAVKLDPDYLNAWKHLHDVQTQLHLPSAERDAVTFNLLRLDPLMRHNSVDFAGVTDLQALWQAIVNSQQLKPLTPTSLFPLPASSAALEAKQKEPKNSNQIRQRMWYNSYLQHGDELTPASAIGRQGMISTVNQFFGGSGGFSSFE